MISPYIILTILLCLIIGIIFPRNEQKLFSYIKLYDLFWFLTNEVILNFFLAFIIVNLISNHEINLAFLNISSFRLISQFLIFYLTIDFVNYWAHRILHTLEPLKYIHKIHHSATELNPLTTFRHSALEHLYFYSILGLTAICFKIDDQVKSWAIFLSVVIDIIQHSNFNIKLPYFFNYVFILPRNHYFHHAKEHYLKGGQNFGLTFSFWDILFKSFYLPKEMEDIELGLRNDNLSKNPLLLVIYPFFSDKTSKSKPIL